jgi:hypothetical protein
VLQNEMIVDGPPVNCSRSHGAMLQSPYSPVFPMSTIERYIASPTSIGEARLIADLVLQNLSRNFDVVRASLRDWDRAGCNYLE